MLKIGKSPRLLLAVSMLWLLSMQAGCATPILRDVGMVVVPPKVEIPPPPALVEATEPKPAGYFQSLLLNYFGDSPAKQTR